MYNEVSLQNRKPISLGGREVTDTARGLQREWLGGEPGTRVTGGGTPAARYVKSIQFIQGRKSSDQTHFQY